MNAVTETRKVGEMSSDEIKAAVKENYEKVAKTSRSACCTSSDSQEEKSWCSPDSCEPTTAKFNLRSKYAKELGYDISDMPQSASESFAGCGNPIALASLKEGEKVLDLGSGAGLDMFHAARGVGTSGKVIGVDMTQAMLDKARYGAQQLGLNNVEFRLGDIEDLPIEAESVDVIISNCVINLAPDKAKVFKEAYRVLRPGGRMMLSDIVLEKELPEEVRQDISYYAGCIGGAVLEEEYLQYIRNAGFVDVRIMDRVGCPPAISARIAAYKPE